MYDASVRHGRPTNTARTRTGDPRTPPALPPHCMHADDHQDDARTRGGALRDLVFEQMRQDARMPIARCQQQRRGTLAVRTGGHARHCLVNVGRVQKAQQLPHRLELACEVGGRARARADEQARRRQGRAKVPSAGRS